MDRRASFAGIALIVVGATLLAFKLDLITFTIGAVLWGLAAVWGGVMLFRGWTRPNPSRGGIFWGTILLSVGVLRTLNGLLPMGLDPGVEGPLYLAAPAIGLILVVVRRPRDWHMLVPAAALLALAWAMYMTEVGTLTRGEVMDTVSQFWPVALVAFGLSLILTGWRRSEPS
jgi:hypothetical protein